MHAYIFLTDPVKVLLSEEEISHKPCEVVSCDMSIKGEVRLKVGELGHPIHALEGTTAALVGGDIYVHGGFGTRRYPLYKFSLTTKQWTSIEGCTYRYTHSCMLVDDSLYIVGGRSSGRGDLPIEVFDIALGRTLQYEKCPTEEERALFVESRRTIVILGRLREKSGLHTLGFNVDTKRLVEYRTTGERPSGLSQGASVVECNQKVFLMSSGSEDQAQISVLFLGPVTTAIWTQLRLAGAFVPVLRYSSLEVLEGLIVCFGGATMQGRGSSQIYFIHPFTGEVAEVGSNIRRVGAVPGFSAEMGSVSTQNKMWLFGAAHGKKQVEMEFRKE